MPVEVAEWASCAGPFCHLHRRFCLSCLSASYVIRSGYIAWSYASLSGENAIETVSLARRIVDLAEDKQAHEIALLDIRTQSTIADFFVICSGDNDRQLRAIVDHIDAQVQKQYGLNPRIEGSSDTGWIVIDYADVVVHVFSNAQRDYYRLDRLWSKVPPVVVVQ